MTLVLSGEDVRAVASDEVIVAAARAAVEAERDALVVVPTRMDVPVGGGFLRVMPAAVADVMGLKVMTLTPELGNRYLILLYRVSDAQLVAMLDADEITRLRTAATTAVAGEILSPVRPRRLGIVGTGFEAEGHLRLLGRLWAPEAVVVYSRSAARREAFAARMAQELGISVTAASDCARACAPQVTVLATKSTQPVVDGDDFPPGAVVLSIGSTRPDLRELDRATLARAGTLLVDDATQVPHESGDIIDALDSGALQRERIVSMAQAFGDPGLIGAGGDRDLLVFKSVGTAVQDLTLAREVVSAAAAHGIGREIGEVTRLKRFAGVAEQALQQLGEDRS